jgi:hypothetical protein
MSDPETRLAQLWALDEPPARDFAFETKVAERIERRRVLLTVLEIAAMTVAGLTVAWAAWPFVSVELLMDAPMLAVAAAVGLAVWSVDRTLERFTYRGYEEFTRDFASERRL